MISLSLFLVSSSPSNLISSEPNASRTETMPTGRPFSTTGIWRKPLPCIWCSAFTSRRSGVIVIAGHDGADFGRVRIYARRQNALQTVAFGDDPDERVVLDHHDRADAVFGHRARSRPHRCVWGQH